MRRWIRERVFFGLWICFLGCFLTLIWAIEFGDETKGSYQMRRDVYVQGQILSSVVQREWSRGSRRSSRKLIYLAVVKYRYSVRNRTYFNDQPLLNRRAFSEWREALEVADSYPENSLVRVYYDPTQPSISTLDFRSRRVWNQGVSWLDIALFGWGPIGAFFCFVFIAFDLFWPLPPKTRN